MFCYCCTYVRTYTRTNPELGTLEAFLSFFLLSLKGPSPLFLRHKSTKGTLLFGTLFNRHFGNLVSVELKEEEKENKRKRKRGGDNRTISLLPGAPVRNGNGNRKYSCYALDNAPSLSSFLRLRASNGEKREKAVPSLLFHDTLKKRRG